MELKCALQKYAWGKIGAASAAASLVQSSSDDDFKIEPEEPYAELWMGTHPNGPSTVKSSGQPLKEFIEKEGPENILGENCFREFGGELPFLLKVLSVNKALSIQAHPDKELAEKLHAEKPEIYKDPNHKPEMALALTDFEGLCGFRPLNEIQTFIRDVRQLRACLGDTADEFLRCSESNYSDSLQKVFTALMMCDKETIAVQLSSLEAEMKAGTEDRPLKELFLRLNRQYPGDVGCFVIYFLNHVTLKPGEAMFLEANLPHAYISGDCVECMACSDNVVRAGLTPKLIDVDTLCSMLKYRVSADIRFSPKRENEVTDIYDPPIRDFIVAKHVIKSKATLTPRNSASLLIVTQGHGKINKRSLKRGAVLFLKAKEVIEIVNSNGEEDIIAFQAFC